MQLLTISQTSQILFFGILLLMCIITFLIYLWINKSPTEIETQILEATPKEKITEDLESAYNALAAARYRIMEDGVWRKEFQAATILKAMNDISDIWDDYKEPHKKGTNIALTQEPGTPTNDQYQRKE